MNALHLDHYSSPDLALRDLVGRFGLRATLSAFVRLLLARRRPDRPPDVEELPDWLRRDVGLPPRPAQPHVWLPGAPGGGGIRLL